jgi:large subunit ribosomal protein L18
MSGSMNESRLKRRQRIRRKLSGTGARPRLSVYKSLKHIYAQVVDDSTGRTMAFASDLDKELRETLSKKKAKKTEVAQMVGTLLAKKAIAVQVDKVVFDRNGFPYHGRIEAVAKAAREAGLKF